MPILFLFYSVKNTCSLHKIGYCIFFIYDFNLAGIIWNQIGWWKCGKKRSEC